MKGFKQCEQGHFYNDSLPECNYCPKNNSSNSEEKTELLGGSNNDQTIDRHLNLLFVNLDQYLI